MATDGWLSLEFTCQILQDEQHSRKCWRGHSFELVRTAISALNTIKSWSYAKEEDAPVLSKKFWCPHFILQSCSHAHKRHRCLAPMLSKHKQHGGIWNKITFCEQKTATTTVNRVQWSCTGPECNQEESVCWCSQGHSCRSLVTYTSSVSELHVSISAL